MNIPNNLFYTKSHEWVQFLDSTTARIGLTDYAQDALGDIVFANLPQEGDTVEVSEPFGDVESVKAVSDVYSPVSGEVTGVNEEILDSPEQINQDPYGTWFIEVSNITDKADFLTPEEYEAICKEEV